MVKKIKDWFCARDSKTITMIIGIFAFVIVAIQPMRDEELLELLAWVFFAISSFAVFFVVNLIVEEIQKALKDD